MTYLEERGETCNQSKATKGMLDIPVRNNSLYSYLQLWERRSRFVEDSKKWMWDDITPSMMSDEEPMPDGKIARKRPCWRGDEFNDFMSALDSRANGAFKQSARKERILSTPIETPAPLNIKDWMKN